MTSHASDRGDTGWWQRVRRRGDQVGIPCVFMRAGTSRGAFLREEDLPNGAALREKLILAIYGSPDFRQIDGLGGATSLTSKVAIVGPPTRPDADVDYTFGQVRIDEARVDFKGNCGNISSGIGPFAIEEGMVPATSPVTAVRIHLTNSSALLVAEVPVADGLCPVQGDAQVAGVPGRGAPIMLDWADVSGTLGRGLLPTGQACERLPTAIGEIDVSIVDAGNVTVFVRPSVFGLRAPDFATQRLDAEALRRIEAVRHAAALRLDMVEQGQRAADVTPTIPKLYMVAAPCDYIDANGLPVAAEDHDLLGRGMSMGMPHAAYAGTVAVCTGAAALIDGTLVNEAARPARLSGGGLRIGHPMGILEIHARVDQTGPFPTLERAAVVRTARRIMEGIVYVPLNRLA